MACDPARAARSRSVGGAMCLASGRSPPPRSTARWRLQRRRRRPAPGRPRGATALPAHVGIVAAYLSSLADSGRKASTIGRRAAAIGYHHKMAGHEPPTGSEGVKAVLRGIRRTIGAAKQGKAPATADLIGQMLALCPDNMIGRRDRALLCLGFAGAFRRSELCALEVADLTEVPDGLRILIRRSKGDQEGQGQEGRDSPRLQAPPGRPGRQGLSGRPWRTTARRGS